MPKLGQIYLHIPVKKGEKGGGENASEMPKWERIFMQRRYGISQNHLAGNIGLAPWPLVWPTDDFNQ